MKELNINSVIKVKLNKKGIDILKEEHDKMNQLVPGIAGKFQIPVDENGYTSFVLWDLMLTFGKEMNIGGVLPFDTNIEIPDEYLVEKSDERGKGR